MAASSLAAKLGFSRRGAGDSLLGESLESLLKAATSKRLEMPDDALNSQVRQAAGAARAGGSALVPGGRAWG